MSGASDAGASRGAVLLDLDGTLVDSRAGIVAGMNATLEGLGLTARPAAELEARIGPPAHDTFAWLLDVGPADPAVEAALLDYRARYAGLMLAHTTVYRGVPDALASLHAAGYALAIATSKSQPLAVTLAAGLGFADVMTAICGPLPPARDDKATTIAQALQALGAPARAVMVGDRHHDIEGAHANGIPAIGALWGIGDRTELTGAGAQALCATPQDMVAAVRRVLD